MSRFHKSGIFTKLRNILLIAILASWQVAFAGAPFLNSNVAHADAGSITATNHEGQLNPSGSYSNGNITTYKEGDSINFRFTLASSQAAAGQIQVDFTNDGGSCQFFDGSFVLGSTTNVSGTSPVVATVGTPIAITSGPNSGDWAQTLSVNFSSAGQAVTNYTLKLTTEAGNCNGSSQHSRLNNVSGDVANIGAQNVPVPAQDILLLPSITITKTVTQGPALPSDFTFTVSPAINNQATYHVTDTSSSSGSVLIDNIPTDGNYTITESGPAGYSFASGSGTSCTFNGSTATAAVAAGRPSATNATCNFTNSHNPDTLTVVKKVVNDNGGTSSASSFVVKVNGTQLTGGTTSNGGLTDAYTYSNPQDSTPYMVSEDTVSSYAQTSLVCTDNATGAAVSNPVSLSAGQGVTCTITNDDVAPSLTLNKIVSNTHGGTAVESNWTLTATGPTTLSGPGAAGSTDVVSGSGFKAGTYALSESGAPSGYSASDWTCTNSVAVTNSQITLANGQSTVCSITNSDIAPSLTVTKVVVNPYGTPLDPSSFPLFVDSISVTSGVATTQFNAGTHTVTETQQSGYTLTGVSGNCTQANNIISLTLSIGGTSTCTLTNTAIQPKLTVIKHVVNDNGGNKTAGNFTMNVTGTNVSSSSFAGAESPGTTVTLNEGSYSVDEGSHTGYTETMSGDCDSTIAIGQTKTCTITNNDIAPTLKLVKQVTNTNGGTKTPADWTLTASGSGGFSDTGDSTTFHAVTANVNYALSESTVPGYAAGSWSCDGGAQVGSNVALSPGQNVTCTITNSDVAATLTLVKTVVDNNGGTKTVNDFQGKIDGNNVAWATAISLSAGAHTASEVNLPGYSAGSWGGDCAADGSITLANAQNATCTITNDDVAPSLTLNKIVSNTHGGTAIESDWTLTATGPTTLSGPGAAGSADVISDSTFKAGTYSLSESGSPTGYAASDWTCTNNVTVTSSQITLANGQSTVCSITNSDIAPSLTVTKVVVNPYGTALDPSSFPLAVDGITVTSGVPTTQFNAGSHTVTETQHSGYTLTGVSGNCSQSNNTINLTLSVGGTSTCTLTNTAIQPKLTVIKHVINDNSGTSSASDFTMTVTGNSIGSLSFAGDENGTTVGLNEGAYTVGETSHVGYAETFSGDCNSTISIGGTKTCTITNNDIPNPGIHIVKSGPSVAHEGDKVTYNFTVTNTGDIALSNVTVDDNVAGGAVYQSGDTNGNHMLDTNETWTFTKDYTIPTPQIADVVNTAEACGDFSDGTTSGTDVCDSDSHTLDVLHPAISVEKFGPNTAFAGDTVTYEFDVTNTGDTPLSGLTVNDNVAGAGTFTGGDTNSNGMLDLGETWIYTKQFTIPSNQTSDITNTVTACGSDSLQLQDCDTDDHTTTVLNPGIHVVKTGPSSAAAGSTVTYTFTVTNTGNTSLDSIAVNDNIAGAGVYQSGDTNGNSMLDTTETWIYTAQYNIPANQFNSVTNTVTACGSTTTDNEIELEVADLNNSKTVCAQDSHTLVIPKVLAEVTPPQLVNTGEPAILSVIAGLITISLVAGISLATKQNKR